MDPEHGLLVQILRDLASREAAWNAEADLRPELSDIYRYLERNLFRRCTEEEIEQVIQANPEAGDLHAWGGFLFLRPCETRVWAVPVMTMEYQFAPPPRIGLRLGLFLFDNESQSVVSTGYRYESPDAGGEHDFFHMQQITELGNRAFPLPTPPWVSQNKPAVPLDAGTDVGLLLCLLAALYGPQSDVIAEIASSQYRNMLSTHIKSVRWAANMGAA